MKYDYLVVGSGLSGAVFSQKAKEKGKSVLVVEKRGHIAGNCYSEYRDGIHVHMYGGHILHCNDEGLWAYINRFAKIRQYEHRVIAEYEGHKISLPFNLRTIYDLGESRSPAEAVEYFEERRRLYPPGNDLESWCIHQVGPTMYEVLIEGYTLKQWGRHPKDLPASIIKRIPIRTTWDDRYFSDIYQGMPENGYTQMIANMLDGVKVELEVDYFEERGRLDRIARHVVYTGPIDSYFGCSLGRLEYRSLRHEHKLFKGDFQGCATVNYTSVEVPYTRTMEWKYFGHLADHLPHSWVTWEYPEEYNGENVPMYPIADAKNMELYRKYKAAAEAIPDVHFTGRLGTYAYLDMHMAIAQSLKLAREIL